MGLCLEEACELAVVERRAGICSNLWPSGDEVIGPLRLGAFASPGSPRRFTIRLGISSDHE
jgi:hypothetical protein